MQALGREMGMQLHGPAGKKKKSHRIFVFDFTPGYLVLYASALSLPLHSTVNKYSGATLECIHKPMAVGLLPWTSRLFNSLALR